MCTKDRAKHTHTPTQLCTSIQSCTDTHKCLTYLACKSASIMQLDTFVEGLHYKYSQTQDSHTTRVIARWFGERYVWSPFLYITVIIITTIRWMYTSSSDWWQSGRNRTELKFGVGSLQCSPTVSKTHHLLKLLKTPLKSHAGIPQLWIISYFLQTHSKCSKRLPIVQKQFRIMRKFHTTIPVTNDTISCWWICRLVQVRTHPAI